MNDAMTKEILVVNGQPVEVAKQGGVVYNLAPVREIIALEFKGLVTGEEKVFDLSKYIDCTCQIVDVTACYESDNFVSTADAAFRTEDTTGHAMIRLFEEGELKSAGEYRIRRGFNVDESTILSPKQTLKILPEIDFKLLTFYCERIIYNSISISE